MPNSVTKRDLIAGFQRVGVQPGDIVCVHSSLSSFGRVGGGATTVVEAMLECLTEAGTLMAPTFSDYFLDENPVYDRENTPSEMGVISETVRTWPAAVRSDHPSHPWAAIGPAAGDLFPPDQQTAWGTDSPLKRLETLDAKVLLIGVSFNTVTLCHLLEFERRVPYRQWIDVTGTVILDGRRITRTIPTFNRKPGIRYNFIPLLRVLEQHKLISETTIGQSQVRCFSAAPALALGREHIRQDENFLLAR